MKKILILVLLCSTLFCQAKDVYFDGMSFEFKSQGMIKLFPREIEADGVSWIFLTINKNIPHNVVSLLNGSLVAVSKQKQDKKSPDQILEEVIEKTMEQSANSPKKFQVKSISEIKEGRMNGIRCKYIDIENPKGVRIRQYSFAKDGYVICITISWFGVKKLEKFEKVIEDLRVIDTFEFMPE